jgi:molybdopterin-containing oxidoreductase family membrane subunit
MYRQVVEGHIITGMRDNVVWGVYIVNFVFFLGLSYAGALLAGIFHLARVGWARPLQRILKLITVFALLIAPVYILLCLGRPDRLFNLFLMPRIQSPIIWDVIAIVTDIIFCVVYLYFTFIKDFALLRDHAEEIGMPEWRLKLYRFFAIGYRDTPEQKKSLNFALDVMAAIIIPTSIVAYSLLAWLFGMNLRVGWHSSIFGPYFVLTATFSGVALLIFIMWLFRKTQKLEKVFNDEHFMYLGYALVILSLFYGYFYFSDYLTDWYNMSHTYKILWAKLTDPNQYGLLLLTGLLFTTGAPIVIIAFPWLRSVNSIALTSVLILVGIWIMRYLMIVPVLETPFIPMQDARPDWVHYSGTWIEWSLTAAGVALFTLLIICAAKIAPIVPISELVEKKEAHKLMIYLRTRKKTATTNN